MVFGERGGGIMPLCIETRSARPIGVVDLHTVFAVRLVVGVDLGWRLVLRLALLRRRAFLSRP